MIYEILYYSRWILIKKNFFKFVYWLFFKINKIFKRKIYSRYSIKNYPKEIQLLVNELSHTKTNSNYYNYPKQKSIKYSDLFIKLQLASKELNIINSDINWKICFEDPEDEESLHRWNWILHLFSTKNPSVNLNNWVSCQRLKWVKEFSIEIESFNNKFKNLPRWESYTISERISNSILFSQLFKCDESLFLKESIHKQVTYLINRLEYFGADTGNHIINNGRAIFLSGVFYKNEKWCQLAKVIFGIELPKLITEDGFLREGSSHYQYLFTRWLLEIYYFGILSNDTEIQTILKPQIEKLLKQCKFFQIESRTGQIQIPLFGDISPDFHPSWLINMLDAIVDNGNNIAHLQLNSWNRLWLKENTPFEGLEKNNIVRSLNEKNLNYPKSGWNRFHHGDTVIILRADNKGIANCAGHHHQDAGHFCLYYKGMPILVDAGRLNYIGHSGLEPEAHNTLTLNGLGVVPRNPSFFPNEYSKNKQIVEHHLKNGELSVIFTSDGFSRIINGLKWSRIWSLKHSGIEIMDKLNGYGNHSINLYFHFASGFRLISSGDLSWNCINGKIKSEFKVLSPFPMTTILHSGGESKLGWQVVSYGKRIEATTLEIKGNFKLPTTIVSTINFN
jgi:hypothetical protein